MLEEQKGRVTINDFVFYKLQTFEQMIKNTLKMNTSKTLKTSLNTYYNDKVFNCLKTIIYAIDIAEKRFLTSTIIINDKYSI